MPPSTSSSRPRYDPRTGGIDPRLTIKPPREEWQWHLDVIAQPIIGRAAGFNEPHPLDSPIIPGPVVRVTCKNAKNETKPNNEILDSYKNLALVCEAYDEHGRVQIPYVWDKNGERYNALAGQVIYSHFQVYDPNRRHCIVFSVNDVAFRVEGRFRLKFILTQLENGASEIISAMSNVIDSVDHKIYPRKVNPITPIHERIAAQGVPIFTPPKLAGAYGMSRKGFRNNPETSRAY